MNKQGQCLGWFKVSDWVATNDAPGLRQALDLGQLSQSDVNFAFQSACEAGKIEAARVLLEPCSVMSVSRGIVKSSWKAHLECMMLAMGRLEREAAFNQFDLALALYGLDMSNAQGVGCARELMARAESSSQAWALRQLMCERRWDRARDLLEAGAAWDESPGLKMLGATGVNVWTVGTSLVLEKNVSPKLYWSMRQTEARKSLDLVPGQPLILAGCEREALLKEAFAESASRADAGLTMKGFPCCERVEARSLRL